MEIQPVSDNVHKLQLIEVGEDFRFDADAILEAAKGNSFARMSVIGELPDGSIWVTGSANVGETLILMEMVKRQLIFGDST
jgi:hypothetical protein